MLLLQAAMWAGCSLLYFASPVLQMNDSQYSMLTAESIIHNHTPDSRVTIASRIIATDLPFDTIAGSHAYQLARTNGRLLYGFGHGTSILSIPFVAMMDHLRHFSCDARRTYNLEGEVIIEKFLPRY